MSALDPECVVVGLVGGKTEREADPMVTDGPVHAVGEFPDADVPVTAIGVVFGFADGDLAGDPGRTMS